MNDKDLPTENLSLGFRIIYGVLVDHFWYWTEIRLTLNSRKTISKILLHTSISVLFLSLTISLVLSNSLHSIGLVNIKPLETSLFIIEILLGIFIVVILTSILFPRLSKVTTPFLVVFGLFFCLSMNLILPQSEPQRLDVISNLLLSSFASVGLAIVFSLATGEKFAIKNVIVIGIMQIIILSDNFSSFNLGMSLINAIIFASGLYLTSGWIVGHIIAREIISTKGKSQ